MKKVIVSVNTPRTVLDSLFKSLRQVNAVIKTLKNLKDYNSDAVCDHLEDAARILRGDLLASIYIPSDRKEATDGEEGE
jgi:hypothetical protein